MDLDTTVITDFKMSGKSDRSVADSDSVSGSGNTTSVSDSFNFYFNEHSELCSKFHGSEKTDQASSATLDICRVMETIRGQEFSSLFKTICSTEAEDSDNCRKKRCTDRYDSSESSDSGVATLSCSDSTGSISSDSTDPGSPLSTSSGFECSESPTPTEMAPNSAFPWNKRRSTDEALLASFDLKRLKVDEDAEEEVLNNNNNNNNNCQVVKNGNFEVADEELEKLVLDRVKCCFRNSGNGRVEPQVRKALFGGENAATMLRSDLRSLATKKQKLSNGNAGKLSSSKVAKTQLQFKSPSSKPLPQTNCQISPPSHLTGDESPDTVTSADDESSTLSESASSGTFSEEEPDTPISSSSPSRTIPANILSKTLVVKCENLSNLTEAKMPVKCGTNVFHIETLSSSDPSSKLISDPKKSLRTDSTTDVVGALNQKPKCVNRRVETTPETKVTQVSSNTSSSVQFRVPNACPQTRRKLRSTKSPNATSGLSSIPESATNPFAFSRNFPGAYLLSPTYINGCDIQLPEIPLVPGGLGRFSSTGCVKICSRTTTSFSPSSPSSQPTDTVSNGGEMDSSKISYLSLRGVVSVPISPISSTRRSGSAQANNNIKTDESKPETDPDNEDQDSTYRLPLSIYDNNSNNNKLNNENDLRLTDSSSSCSSAYSNFSEESNLSAESAPILTAPKNIRFPKQIEKSVDDRYFQEEILCRWRNCSQDFSSNAALVEHLQTKHVKEQTSGEVSSCLWEGCKCYGKLATNKGYLENHVITHAGKKPFSCIFQRCGLSFSSQGALARHVGQHFIDDDGTNSSKKTPESPQNKPIRRKLRKNRCCKRPSARVSDYFDSSALERLNEKFATDTLRRTQGIFNENDDGCSITLLSQVCAKRTEPNGTVRYLLRWFPRGIIEEEWLTKDKIQGHRFVDMKTLPEEEKQMCLNYIFQGSAVPEKASRKLIGSNQNCS